MSTRDRRSPEPEGALGQSRYFLFRCNGDSTPRCCMNGRRIRGCRQDGRSEEYQQKRGLAMPTSVLPSGYRCSEKDKVALEGLVEVGRTVSTALFCVASTKAASMTARARSACFDAPRSGSWSGCSNVNAACRVECTLSDHERSAMCDVVCFRRTRRSRVVSATRVLGWHNTL